MPTDEPRLPSVRNPYDESARAMDRAHALARTFVLGLPTRPVGRAPTPEAMAAALDEPLPKDGFGEDWDRPGMGIEFDAAKARAHLTDEDRAFFD